MPLPLSIDRSSPEPLYRQVERQVREAIDNGRLRPGERVPSVRDVARDLDVGRLTVATAYEQLAADGYLVGRVGFGTVVAPSPPSMPAPASRIPGRPEVVATRGGTAIDLRPGTSGGAGMAVGPQLERLLRESWRDLAGSTSTPDPAGDPLLRAAVAEHVRINRGGRCDADQVVVLSGPVIGITAAAGVWLGAGRSIALEDPPDPTFRPALELAGVDVRPIPIDRHGLRPDDLPSTAAVALASARVHALTGAQMPLARRITLLERALALGAVVLEDARGDDLLLAAAGPSLQGLDEDGRVVHLGGFGALFHPGIQLGYAVLPPALVGPFASAVAALDPGATPVQQRALGRFLADGLLDAHLVRVRRTVADRVDATAGALRRELGWLVSVETPAGGTRIVATIEDDRITASDAARAAGGVGVAIEPLSRFRIAPATDRELVFDVGRHEAAELAAAVRAVAAALAEERRRLRARPAVPQRPSMAPIPRRWPALTHPPARPADRRHEATRAGAPRAAREA